MQRHVRYHKKNKKKQLAKSMSDYAQCRVPKPLLKINALQMRKKCTTDEKKHTPSPNDTSLLQIGSFVVDVELNKVPPQLDKKSFSTVIWPSPVRFVYFQEHFQGVMFGRTHNITETEIYRESMRVFASRGLAKTAAPGPAPGPAGGGGRRAVCALPVTLQTNYAKTRLVKKVSATTRQQQN
ncbi:hypothetical protein EVAR_5765_1 [Eumeta japonica]|uniref:Uncharacterized protein n=1 Tax=Eumeta variegata TaxID=151549 RepID=A0A4C1T5C8_EUMVA|nr:hypothetical protein EVAR_5765_1 [Eumeta japonica]